MDKLLEKWLDESIGDCDTMVEVPRISLRAALYAEIANYRAPAWTQSPRRVCDSGGGVTGATSLD